MAVARLCLTCVLWSGSRELPVYHALTFPFQQKLPQERRRVVLMATRCMAISHANQPCFSYRGFIKALSEMLLFRGHVGRLALLQLPKDESRQVGSILPVVNDS